MDSMLYEMCTNSRGRDTLYATKSSEVRYTELPGIQCYSTFFHMAMHFLITKA